MSFFDELAELSRRYERSIGIKQPDLDPWSSGMDECFRGVVFHYTADPELDRVLKWFERWTYGARASSHVVIDTEMSPEVRELAKDLPLVRDLPATVIQVIPPTRRAWHATWASSWSYGIELINPGELEALGDRMVDWRGKAYEGDTITVGRRHWVPYSPAQLEAAAIVADHYQAAYSLFDEERILGHEQVQGVHTRKGMGEIRYGTDKRDPGPLFPVAMMRDYLGRMASQEEIPPYDWGDHARELEDRRVCYLRGFDTLETPAQEAKLLLHCLGYCIRKLGDFYTPREQTSLRIFQRMAGLKTDGIPGPRTIEALRSRVEDRGWL